MVAPVNLLNALQPTLSSGMDVFKRILVVAPATGDLEQNFEIDAIQGTYDAVNILQGEVTDYRLYQQVSGKNRLYDIILFIGHGDQDVFQITRGKLTRNAVLQVVRLTGAKIVFLNSCNSVTLGQTLVNGGLPVCICSIVAIQDDAAWQTSITFFVALASTGDVGQSFKMACTGPVIEYVMLSDGAYAALLAKPAMDGVKQLTTMLQSSDELTERRIGESAEDRKKLHKEMNRLMVMWYVGLAVWVILTLFLAYHVMVQG